MVINIYKQINCYPLLSYTYMHGYYII